MKRPIRKTLATEVADIIADEIAKNRWGDTLPGYRPLGVLLGVSSRTTTEAIKLLTDRGVLLPSEKGRRRRIARHSQPPSSVPDQKIRIVYENKIELDHGDSVIFSRLRKALGKNWNIEDCRTRAYELKHPNKVLDTLVNQNPDCRWVFVSPTSAIAQWIENSDLNIICIGGDITDRSVHGLATSHTESICAILENLFQ